LIDKILTNLLVNEEYEITRNIIKVDDEDEEGINFDVFSNGSLNNNSAKNKN